MLLNLLVNVFNVVGRLVWLGHVETWRTYKLRVRHGATPSL